MTFSLGSSENTTKDWNDVQGSHLSAQRNMRQEARTKQRQPKWFATIENYP